MWEDNEFIANSNAIEGYEYQDYRPGSHIYDGHLAAFHHLIDSVKKNGVTEEDILEAHRLLLEKEWAEIAGKYRLCGVRVGNHIAPAYYAIPGLMQAYVMFANQSETEKDCWNSHFNFEDIHPFRDGNGRTGRSLLNAMLMAKGHDPVVVLADERWEYYKKIQQWRFDRDVADSVNRQGLV